MGTHDPPALRIPLPTGEDAPAPDEQQEAHQPPEDDPVIDDFPESDEGPDEEIDWLDTGLDAEPSMDTPDPSWASDDLPPDDGEDVWDNTESEDDEPTEDEWSLDGDGQEDEEDWTLQGDDERDFIRIGYEETVTLPDLGLASLPALSHSSRARTALVGPFRAGATGSGQPLTILLPGRTDLSIQMDERPDAPPHLHTRIILHDREFSLDVELLEGNDWMLFMGRDLLGQGFLLDVSPQS